MHCCNINKSRRGDFFLVHLVYLSPLFILEINNNNYRMSINLKIASVCSLIYSASAAKIEPCRLTFIHGIGYHHHHHHHQRISPRRKSYKNFRAANMKANMKKTSAPKVHDNSLTINSPPYCVMRGKFTVTLSIRIRLTKLSRKCMDTTATDSRHYRRGCTAVGLLLNSQLFNTSATAGYVIRCGVT